MTAVPFFDSHCLLGPELDGRRTCLRTARELVGALGYYGIGRALVSHSVARDYDPVLGNSLLMRALRGEPSLVPQWVLLPPLSNRFPDPETLVSCMLAEGVRGARLYPTRHGFAFDDVTCGPLLAALARHRVPLFLDYAEVSCLSDHHHAQWRDLADVCGRYPTLPIVIGSFPVWNKCNYLYPLLGQHANLYLELSGHELHLGIEDYCSRFGPSRLLFGTNLPAFSPGVALAKVSYALIGEQEKQLIAGGNLEHLLSEVNDGSN